jgi:hypothetical protein
MHRFHLDDASALAPLVRSTMRYGGDDTVLTGG